MDSLELDTVKLPTKTLVDSEYLTFATSELQNGQFKPTNFAREMPTKFEPPNNAPLGTGQNRRYWEGGVIRSNYGVPSCNGCRTFFRRSLLASKIYACKLNEMCSKMIGISRCRACRFDRCILTGMNPRAMKFPTSVDVAMLSEKVSIRRRYLSQKYGERCNVLTGKTGPVFEETIEEKIIQSLVYVELKVKKIRENSRWLCESVIFRTIRELLESNHGNVLAHADQYPEELKWPLTYDEALRLDGSEMPKWLMSDMFLCIEMARTMPVFSQLDYNDQEALLKQIILTNTILQESFYSYQMKSETFIMPNGFLPILLPKVHGSKILADMIMLISCRPMLAMSRIQMTMEEFVLLKAIIYSHSAIHGLSERGRALLQKESVRYAKTLMKHLQSQMGAAPGAKKYAEIISFVGCLLIASQHQRDMHIYSLLVHTLFTSPFPGLSLAAQSKRQQWEITSRHNSTLYYVHISGLFLAPHTITKLTHSHHKEHSSAKVFGLNTQV
ncbi:ligand-binding domain of nuclear hormone receptor domain-containing protein [Ditylenchus destructor]|nr:ligand-binding domain of nuclear hormone receptor domain-containing protein [Ditylenchus destructor]